MAPSITALNTLSDTAIDVLWSDTDPGSVAWKVFRDGNLVQVVTTPQIYHDSGLLANTTYRYRVQSVQSQFWSEASGTTASRDTSTNVLGGIVLAATMVGADSLLFPNNPLFVVAGGGPPTPAPVIEPGPISGIKVARPKHPSLGEAIWDDFLVFDDPEQITLTSWRAPTAANGIASMIDYVAQAFRTQISGREKSPSAGAYAEASVVWRVPAKLLTDAIQPLKARDTVTDRFGNLWTVQKAEFCCFGTDWRLECLNLSIMHDLQDVVDIQRPAITFDPAGPKLKSWDEGAGMKVLYRALPCRVQKITDELVQERGIDGFKGDHAVIVSQQLLVDSSWHENRIRWVDQGVVKYLEIRGYHNPLRIDELPVLDAYLAP